MKHEQKLFLYSILSSFVLVLLVVALMLYTFSVQERKATERASSIINDYNKKFDTLEDRISEEMNILQNIISNVDEKNKERDKEILEIIADVESESRASIEEAKRDLEKELATIEVTGTDFSKVIETSLESVVSVLTNSGQGSGVVVSKKGHVITNLHVIEDARIVRVVDYEKSLHPIEVVGINSIYDIAVLRILTNKTFDYLDFGDSDKLKIGQSVVALGNPLGLDFTATQGIISARRKATDGNEYIQIDVPINPGNSGGPVVDAAGEIIGIANFKIQGAEGIGFAIPSNVVEDVFRDIT